MADFQSQVMGITGLTIDASSTAPSRSEFSTFLNDGVIDVTSRWLAAKPQDREEFIRESATTASNGLDIGGATIISVLREAGADGDTDGSTAWRVCRKISASMQSRVVDTESLHFASKYNPTYAIDDNGVVNVYPIPDGTDDGFRAYYVNNSPEETDGTALDHASTGIKYFPNDKVYLVMLYASIRSLHAAMGATTISDLSVTAVPPDIPILSSITFSSISVVDASITAVATSDILGNSTLPTYTPPKLTGDTQELTATMVAGAPGTAADKLNYEHWWDVLADYIEDEEDSELAGAQLQKISTYIQAYSTAMQNQLNEFNEANVKYQASVQESMAEFQTQNQINISNAERSQNRQLQNAINDMKALSDNNAQLIQKFSSELQEYQAEVSSQVQEYTQNLQADSTGYQWLKEQHAALMAEYNSAFIVSAPPAQAGR